MALINHLTIAIIIIMISIPLTYSVLPDCGTMKIKCHSTRLSECCEGPCCPFLHQYQLQYKASITNIPSEPMIAPKPTSCPKIGEQCSSALSLDEQCCGGGTLLNGGTTSCKYTDTDGEGNKIGTCCVKNGYYGCKGDGDCCKSDGYCNNGKCERNGHIPSTVHAVRSDNGKYDDGDNDMVDTSNNTEDIEDVNNENGPHFIYILIVSMILFVILVVIFCGLYYWYYRRYILKNKRRWQIKQTSTEDMDGIGGGVSECNIDGDTDNIHNDIESSTEN